MFYVFESLVCICVSTQWEAIELMGDSLDFILCLRHWLTTCSAESCDRNGHFWGSYSIHILVSLTSLRIFLPRLEKLLFINHYFIVCILK